MFLLFIDIILKFIDNFFFFFYNFFPYKKKKKSQLMLSFSITKKVLTKDYQKKSLLLVIN